MAELGGSSNFAFELGGEPSREMKTYTAMKRLVGEGIPVPGDEYGDESFVEIWRMAKAQGLASVASFGEAAMYQAFPDTATDEIATYEDILGVFPPFDAPDETRRQLIVDRWILSIESSALKLEDQLAALDYRFSFIAPDPDVVQHVIPGKVLDPVGAISGTFMNGRKHSSWPNYSSDYVLRVLFSIGNVPLTEETAAIRSKAIDILQESLPAWVDFTIASTQGFLLDSSLLDLGSFYP
jgi:hypothetical protein